jgi:hypothetical protein
VKTLLLEWTQLTGTGSTETDDQSRLETVPWTTSHTMKISRRTTLILLAVVGLLTGAVIGGGLGFALGYPEMPGSDPKKQEGPSRHVATAAGVVVGGIAGVLAAIIRASRYEEAKPNPPRRRTRKRR